ncbi:MAG: DUF2157 domain-containing protein [Solimonas sp.]
MAKNAAAWLLAELPELERAGVIDTPTAARLRARYSEAAQSGGALGLSAVLGALLVGLGVILLVAHNWDDWSRGLRLFVTALPLAAGQLACAWALLRRPESQVWRESAAVFAGLAFAAALALVSQIFQFGGDLDRYLLTCALLALPLVYALDSSLLAILAGGALLGWVGTQSEAAREPLLVLLAYATLLPHAWMVWRRDRGSLRSVLLLGWLAPLLFAALTLAMPWVRHFGWLWVGACALLLMQIDDGLGGGLALVRRPLRAYGEAGWALVALAATFPEFWREHFLSRYADGELSQAGIVVGVALLAVAVLTARALWRRQWLLAALALPVLALAAAQGRVPPAMPLALFFNAYVLAIGVALIQSGLRERVLRYVSSGLTLIAVLVLLRFFGGEWSFVMRGVAFVATGLGFLAAHAWLRRKVRA